MNKTHLAAWNFASQTRAAKHKIIIINQSSSSSIIIIVIIIIIIIIMIVIIVLISPAKRELPKIVASLSLYCFGVETYTATIRVD
jgi:hypothetical protein